MRTLLALSAAAIAFGCKGSTPPPGATNTRPPAWLAFQRSDSLGGTLNLMLVSEDGAAVHQLTKASLHLDYVEPTWSPDGKQLGFGRYLVPTAGRPMRLFTARVIEVGNAPRLNDLTQLTPDEGPEEMNVAWSPDGRSVAFTRSLTPEVYAIFVRDLQSGTELQLTSGPDDIFPRWSPKGERVAFVRGGTLQVISRTGGAPTQLWAAGVSSASWHPDGTRLAVAGPRSGIIEVSAIDANGDGEGDDAHSLTEPGVLCDETPEWSPGGDKLAFARRNCDVAPGNARSDLFIKTMPTGAEVNVTRTPNDWEQWPRWRP